MARGVTDFATNAQSSHLSHSRYFRREELGKHILVAIVGSIQPFDFALATESVHLFEFCFEDRIQRASLLSQDVFDISSFFLCVFRREHFTGGENVFVRYAEKYGVWNCASRRFVDVGSATSYVRRIDPQASRVPVDQNEYCACFSHAR